MQAEQLVSATDLLSYYCFMLYQHHGKDYKHVADIVKLDWRTVKGYVRKYEEKEGRSTVGISIKSNSEQDY